MTTTAEQEKRYSYEEYLEVFAKAAETSMDENTDVADKLAEETLEIFRRALAEDAR